MPVLFTTGFRLDTRLNNPQTYFNVLQAPERSNFWLVHLPILQENTCEIALFTFKLKVSTNKCTTVAETLIACSPYLVVVSIVQFVPRRRIKGYSFHGSPQRKWRCYMKVGSCFMLRITALQGFIPRQKIERRKYFSESFSLQSTVWRWIKTRQKNLRFVCAHACRSQIEDDKSTANNCWKETSSWCTRIKERFALHRITSRTFWRNGKEALWLIQPLLVVLFLVPLILITTQILSFKLSSVCEFYRVPRVEMIPSVEAFSSHSKCSNIVSLTLIYFWVEISF